MPEHRAIFGLLSVEENPRIAVRKGSLWTIDDVYRLPLFPAAEGTPSQWRGQLSRCEQQMLAIVRALLKGSKLVMLDEPVEGLAPIEINEIVEQLSRCGQVASIMLVEQNLAVCTELADRHYIYQGSRSEFTADDGIGVTKCRPG